MSTRTSAVRTSTAAVVFLVTRVMIVLLSDASDGGRRDLGRLSRSAPRRRAGRARRGYASRLSFRPFWLPHSSPLFFASATVSARGGQGWPGVAGGPDAVRTTLQVRAFSGFSPRSSLDPPNTDPLVRALQCRCARPPLATPGHPWPVIMT